MNRIGPIGNKNHQTPINMVKNPNIIVSQYGIKGILLIAKQSGPLNKTTKNIRETINAKLAIINFHPHNYSIDHFLVTNLHYYQNLPDHYPHHLLLLQTP